MRLNRQIEGKYFVDPARITRVADQQIAGVIGGEFGGDRFERDLRADAGDVSERDPNPVRHKAASRAGCSCGTRPRGVQYREPSATPVYTA